jgi:hypothetical protein
VGEQKCRISTIFTFALCFLGAGAIVFLGMLTLSNPSLSVDSVGKSHIKVNEKKNQGK